MIPPTPDQKVNQLVRHLRDKGRFLRSGGLQDGNDHQVGLLPTQGWGQRNYRFLKQVVLPSMFTKRSGERFQLVQRSLSHEMTVTWIGHATFLIQIAGKNILIDPNWALWHSIIKRVRQPGLALRDLPPIDLLLVSHAHFDHLHLPSVAQIASNQPVLLPKGVGTLMKRFPLDPIVEMDWWDSFTFEDLKITFTPARHWGARYVHDGHRGFGGFVIESPKGTVFHCGDSAHFDGFSEIGNRFDIDLALLPIGAYDSPSGRPVHMNPEEALDAFLALNAHEMAPMHYGTFPLGGEPMDEPLERLIYRAGSLGISHRVHILGEGKPQSF